jgi:hypothetical protein
VKRFAWLLLVGMPLWAHAEIYKWTDQYGRVHYGDQAPPQGAQKEDPQKSDNPIQVMEGDNGPTGKVDRRRLTRALEKENRQRDKQRAAKAKREAQRERNCGNARQRLRMYQNAGRIFRTDANGQRHYYTDAQRADALEAAQQQVDKWCN